MGVYVTLCIKRGERAARTSALVNSGYEAEEPELHVPLALAKRLSFSLEALRGERYRVVGADTLAYVLGQVEVKLVLEDRETPWLTARAVSVPGEHEVLISDVARRSPGDRDRRAPLRSLEVERPTLSATPTAEPDSTSMVPLLDNL